MTKKHRSEGSVNDVFAHFFRFMNRSYSFFPFHETEKTVS
jgi:hypothetical protein